jgi:indole-3-glycerol phosphate synthase
MNILDEIISKKRTRVNEAKSKVPIEDIQNQLVKKSSLKSNFKKSLENQKQAIIAEIKKASPSAGIIAEDFDPILKVREYEKMGARALSILTEEDYFQGSNKVLLDVKKVTNLPILRKDFIIDDYQIYESKLIGADCILLITSILSDSQIAEYVSIAEAINLDVLIEVHDEEELARVSKFHNALIGVNNRNLKTFEVDLMNAIRLRKNYDGNQIFIAESGIKSSADIEYLVSNDINVFLIGESLMRGNLF